MACKREFLYLQRQFFMLCGMLVGAAVVLGGLAWLTCHEVYTTSLITAYVDMFPMFAYIVPLSMSFGMRALYQLGISFGASRRGLFVAAQLLFALTNVVGICCAVGLRQLMNTLPQPDYMGTVVSATVYTLPQCVLWFLCLQVVVQFTTLLASFDANRWVYAILCGGTAMLVGGYVGITAAMELVPFAFLQIDVLFGRTAFQTVIYWAVVALLLGVGAVAGFFALRRLEKEVAL